MGAITGIRLYAALGTAVVLALLFAWAMRLDALRADWKSKFDALTEQASVVLTSARAASDNPRLSWRDAAAQIDLIGTSRREWKSTADLQSARIDALGAETARLKALSAEAQAKARAIIAKRDTAIARLSAMALTPGDRADCVAQLNAAEAALDLVYQEGL